VGGLQKSLTSVFALMATFFGKYSFMADFINEMFFQKNQTKEELDHLNLNLHRCDSDKKNDPV